MNRMKKEKAYKLLANQMGISNKKAKKLIDQGLVYLSGQRIRIARLSLPENSSFEIRKPEKTKIIFEDKNLVALNKPAFVESKDIEREFGYRLIHRLDQETSGLLLLAKNREFLIKSQNEFRKRKVYKEYLAIVKGIIERPQAIKKRIKTIKKGKAISFISREGKRAITEVIPLDRNKNTKIKILPLTGRTHQIRVHLKYLGHPIFGDYFYGGPEAPRLMLHASRIKLLDYDFTSPEPDEMKKFWRRIT